MREKSTPREIYNERLGSAVARRSPQHGGNLSTFVLIAQPTMPDVLASVCGLLRDLLGDPSLALDATTTAAHVPGWDSLTHVVFILAIERAFDIRFTSVEIAQVTSLGELSHLVESKVPA